MTKLEDDLRELEALRQAELITEDEYRTKRADLIAQFGAPQPQRAGAAPTPTGEGRPLPQESWFWTKAKPFAIVGLVVFIAIAIVSFIIDSVGGDDAADPPSAESQDPTAPSAPAGAEATPVPPTLPPATPTPPAPIALAGAGQFVSEPFVPPSPASRVVLNHQGNANFVVWAYGDQGQQELLVNVIGVYSGSRPLLGEGEWFLEIDADGSWTSTIEAIPFEAAAAGGVSGVGDLASGLFEPRETGSAPVEVRHDGSANFVVWLHCAGGTELVQNEIGPVAGSTVVDFDDGPCLWDVQADGSWSVILR